MKLKNCIITGTALLVGALTYSQSVIQKKANNLFNQYAFADAAAVYHDLIDQGYNTDFAIRQLADSYAYMRNPDSSVVYYKKVIEEQKDIPITYYYSYAQALRGTKNYKESRVWMKRFKEAGGQIDQFNTNRDSDFIDAIFNSKQQYFLKDISFNSKFSDFGAFEHNGSIYFASARDEGVTIKHKYGWNNEPFLDVYVAQSSTDSINHKSKIKGEINTVFHDGPVTITKDGSTMYFSRTSFIKNTLGSNHEGISILKIYKASFINNKWRNIEELPFNSDDYSTGHPALNEDETKLYFASDMPGGMGGSDIYSVTINDNNTFGKPQNLGNTINTKKNERFPFINNEGALFFSSDGHPGLGLLDIFTAISNKNNEIINVINLGTPVNSSKDDFSFFMSKDGLSGYFASNRDGGKGSDDIYAYDRVPQLKIKGTVYDNATNTPIPDAVITLFDVDGKEITRVTSSKNGSYQLDIDRDTNYKMHVKKDRYIDDHKVISSKEIERSISSITADFPMNLAQLKIRNPLPELSHIFFNFDSAVLRPESINKLDSILNLMSSHPEMHIKIESYSDSRGPAEYNLLLSQERATATYNYLVSKGVEPERILSRKGFGEENLVNNCDGSVSCSEEEHQLNRRTEFIVIN
ncbi:OmpA family protein [Cognatitamlana onchidii]|uniref:OmpA family protein n=1 Tax=Cognatitamlana onchidii TaxID=2562860 RepID=UPI0010A61E80|nr:OmpA family protein [Algibacter onchidii]